MLEQEEHRVVHIMLHRLHQHNLQHIQLADKYTKTGQIQLKCPGLAGVAVELVNRAQTISSVLAKLVYVQVWV
jgi:hypothetical protein